MMDLLYIRTKQLLRQRSCFDILAVGWLVVEKMVLH